MLKITFLLLTFSLVSGYDFPYTTDRVCQYWFINTSSNYSQYYKEINNVLWDKFNSANGISSSDFTFLNTSAKKTNLYDELFREGIIVQGSVSTIVAFLDNPSSDFFCPRNKCIRYPLPSNSWAYQYQMVVDNILTDSEDTRTRIQENDFSVLDPVVANDLQNFLKGMGYIKVIKGDMYPVAPTNTTGCDNAPVSLSIAEVPVNQTNSSGDCTHFMNIDFCYYPILPYINILVSGLILLCVALKCDEKKK